MKTEKEIRKEIKNLEALMETADDEHWEEGHIAANALRWVLTPPRTKLRGIRSPSHSSQEPQPEG